MRTWWLSQFYLHQEYGFIWPVCDAYGSGTCCPWHNPTSAEDGQWALIRMSSEREAILASKDDPRVIYVGDDWAPVPPQVLQIYAKWLDPNATYTFLGQVISKLAEWSPSFHSVDDNYGK